MTEFSAAYLEWVKVRRNTLKGLCSLADELHDKQNKYNNTQRLLENLNSNLHSQRKYSAVFGSAKLFSFLTVIYSGTTFFEEAFYIDTCQKKFYEIMLSDSEATKTFCEARARCVKDYRDIQEVEKNHQLNTFDSVLATISTAMLRIPERTVDIRQLDLVRRSIINYVKENPAVLGVYKSAVFVMDHISLFRDEKKRLELKRNLKDFVNFINSKEMETLRMELAIGQDLSQSKLESKIRCCIDKLRNELDNASQAHPVLDH